MIHFSKANLSAFAVVLISSLSHAAPTPATYDCYNANKQVFVLTITDDQSIEFFIQENPPTVKNLLGTATLEAGSNPQALRKYYGAMKDENGSELKALSDLRVTFSSDGTVSTVETVNNNIIIDSYSNCTVDNGQ